MNPTSYNCPQTCTGSSIQYKDTRKAKSKTSTRATLFERKLQSHLLTDHYGDTSNSQYAGDYCTLASRNQHTKLKRKPIVTGNLTEQSARPPGGEGEVERSACGGGAGCCRSSGAGGRRRQQGSWRSPGGEGSARRGISIRARAPREPRLRGSTHRRARRSQGSAVAMSPSGSGIRVAVLVGFGFENFPWV